MSGHENKGSKLRGEITAASQGGSTRPSQSLEWTIYEYDHNSERSRGSGPDFASLRRDIFLNL
jgi:hypothetical protein